ncbi:MAG: alpha/beta hydrolase [Thermodesulfobacteriota bacterium]
MNRPFANMSARPRDPFFSRLPLAVIKLFLFVFFRPAFAFATARSPAWNIAWLRLRDKKHPSARQVKGCSLKEISAGGVACTMILPNRLAHKDRLIFYLHGGAYVCGPNRFHWPMLADLCRRTGMAAAVVRYSLAPERPFPASINDAMTAYRYFQNRYADICLLGDSAGGGLALAAALKIKAENLPRPSRLVLLSPWLDITLSNPEIANVKNDPFLATGALVPISEAYAAGHDTNDPMLSPIHGDFTGLPPTLLFCGTAEILAPDCRKFREKAGAAGVKIFYEQWPDMFHVWMAAPLISQAAEARKIMARFIAAPDPAPAGAAP